jgi:hypothetical protein
MQKGVHFYILHWKFYILHFQIELLPMKKILFLSTVLGLLLYACGTETFEETIVPEPPHNPFDEIDYSNGNVPDVPVDSHTFLGIHSSILSQSCNQPACHDGTFEPDYRTVQSAYNSLVYHPVTKNYVPTVDGKQPLPYRVTPGDLSQSMLWQRLTIHNPPNFERMPASGNSLGQKELDLIKEWIEGGAKDIFGNEPTPTSQQPFCFGLLAFAPDFFNYRVDTSRGGVPYNPFVTLENVKLEVWFGYYDITPDGLFVLGNELTHNKVQLSTDPFNFTNAVELNLEVAASPKIIKSIFSQPNPEDVPYYQKVTFNPTALGFQKNQIVFMRTYVKDSDHAEPTENPSKSTQFAIMSYFSFIIL